jgi:capsular polysaccharide biosynthesis protein
MFVLSELSFPEQVSLFQDAEYVVAQHGAGLINTAYCKDASIIELRGTGTHDALFYSLAEAKEFKYGCLKCKSDAENIIVNMGNLDDAVVAVMKQDVN